MTFGHSFSWSADTSTRHDRRFVVLARAASAAKVFIGRHVRAAFTTESHLLIARRVTNKNLVRFDFQPDAQFLFCHPETQKSFADNNFIAIL